MRTIRKGQVWRQRYGPQAGRTVTIVNPPREDHNNSFVGVQGQRYSNMRVSTLLERHSPVQEPA